MDSEARNLQNDFFGSARREGATLAVQLDGGAVLVGRLKSFDRFTLLIEGPQGDQIVFKHAISTVTLAGRESTRRAPQDGPGELAHRGPTK